MPSLDPEKVRDITALLVGRVGDLIVATPMLRALKAKFPQARLKMVVSGLCRDLVPLIPWVDYHELLHRFHFIGPNFLLCEGLFRNPCDLALDLNPSFSRSSAALMLAIRKAPVKLGFDKRRKFGEVFTDRVASPQDDEPMLDRYARLAAALDAPYEARPELRLRPQDERAAAEILAKLPPKKGKRILIHPGNFKKFDNRWPEEKFAALAGRLQKQPGVEIYFMAGPGELEAVQGIVARLPTAAKILPPAPIGVTGALMKASDLVVLNVTGTTHLAAALEVPTFCLYAGYTAAVWRPRGERHRGVVSKSWTSCRDISVEEAWTALAPLIKNDTR